MAKIMRIDEAALIQWLEEQSRDNRRHRVAYRRLLSMVKHGCFDHEEDYE